MPYPGLARSMQPCSKQCWRFDDSGRDHAVAAQAGGEGLRLPAAERLLRPVALAFRRPSGALAQPRAGRGFVDEDEPRQGLAEEAPAPLDPKRARLAESRDAVFAG